MRDLKFVKAFWKIFKIPLSACISLPKNYTIYIPGVMKLVVLISCLVALNYALHFREVFGKLEGLKRIFSRR